MGLLDPLLPCDRVNMNDGVYFILRGVIDFAAIGHSVHSGVGMHPGSRGPTSCLWFVTQLHLACSIARIITVKDNGGKA